MFPCQWLNSFTFAFIGINRTSAEVQYTVTSPLHSLCAPAAGSTVSHIQYAGVPCNASANAVLWTGMETLDRNPLLPKRTVCSWRASAEPASWAAQFTGGCGISPTLVQGLPTHFCTSSRASSTHVSTGAGSATTLNTPTPPPAPTLRSLEWTMRGAVTSHKLNASGLDMYACPSSTSFLYPPLSDSFYADMRIFNEIPR